MATLNLYYRWELPLDGKYVNGGSTSLPITLSVTGGAKHDATYSVNSGAANNKIILNVGSAATDDIGSFVFCIVTSTKNGWLEITGTAAADNSTLPITANIPCIIGYSANGTWQYGAAGNFASAASQNITKLNFRQDSGAAATVRIVAFS